MSKTHAQAQSSWAFHDVKLSEFARFSFSQFLNLSFVADDSLVRDEHRISIDLKPDQASQAYDVLVQLLEDAGYTVKRVGQLVKVSKSINKEPENETLIYRPKYRTAQYLIDSLGLGKSAADSIEGTGNAFNNTGYASFNGGSTTQTNTAFPVTTADKGSTKFIPRQSDVVVYSGTKEKVDLTERSIRALDVPESQAEVYAVVYEYTASEAETNAFTAIAEIANKKLSIGIGSEKKLDNFISIDTSVLTAFLSFLNQDKRFNLISAPRILAKSGVQSRLSVGADVPTLGGTTTSQGNVTQSVQYQKTGLILDVQPTVLETAIHLKVKQTLSEAQTTVTGVNGTPTLTNREISTDVVLADKQSIVLGGLTSSKTSKGRVGLSFLPTYFSSKSATDDRTEIIVFLTVSRSAPTY